MRFLKFLLLLITATSNAQRQDAFLYLRDPEYHRTKESAYRRKQPLVCIIDSKVVKHS